MQFTTTVLLLSAAGSLMAFPSVQPNATYVEMYRETTSGGSLVYLGPPQDSNIAPKDVPRLEERRLCTTGQSTTCSSKHHSRNNLCDLLVTELFANPTISVGEAPRQICYEADNSNNFCCVSWSKVIPNLVKSDLATPANSILQQCTTDGVSGKTDNLNMHGVCATVCLSDRGTGCA